MAEEQNKEQQPEQKENQKAKFPWVSSPHGNPEIYTNYHHISWSLVDVRIQFGQLMPDKPDSQTFVSQERAAVTIAWQRAKLLAIALSDLVRSYESVNGEIKSLNLPPAPSEPPKL
jgi:hypothetical protein